MLFTSSRVIILMKSYLFFTHHQVTPTGVQYPLAITLELQRSSPAIRFSYIDNNSKYLMFITLRYCSNGWLTWGKLLAYKYILKHIGLKDSLLQRNYMAQTGTNVIDTAIIKLLAISRILFVLD